MNNFSKTKEALNEKLATKQQLSTKDKIRNYQAKQHKAGNKISWDEATTHIETEIKAVKKAAKKLENAGKKKAKSNKPTKKLMSDAQFKKMCKGAADDFENDDLESVVWDLAASMIYDPSVDKYVRAKMAKNSGRKPEDINKEMVIEFIADTIYG